MPETPISLPQDADKPADAKAWAGQRQRGPQESFLILLKEN